MAAIAIPDRLTVIFDGDCAFCTRSIRYLQKLDRYERLETSPYQYTPEHERHGLTDTEFRLAAYAVAPGGQIAGGGQAATLIASVLLQRTWPVTVGRLPGIRHALDLGYRTIARNRYRLPGDTPACGPNGSCRIR